MAAPSSAAASPTIEQLPAASPVTSLSAAAGVPAIPGLARFDLQQAIELALRREPRVNVALAEIRRADALVKEARSASFPTLTGNAAYTHLDHDRMLNGRVISAQNQLGANLLLSVPVVAPQRWVQTGHASDNLSVTRLNADDVRRQVAVAVAHSYLAVVVQHRAIEVNQRALDNAQAHYTFVHTRFAGGVGNRLDEVRANQEFASSDAALQNAYAALTRAQEALGVLLGVDGPAEVSDEIALPDPPSLEQGLSDAVVHRSDVIASTERWKAAKRVSNDGWTDYMPLLTAALQPFYQNPKTLTQPLTGWQAQLILTVPFYDGGLRYAVAAERDVAVAENQTQLEATLRQAKSEVRVAFAVLQRADASLGSAARAAKLAAEALAMANLAYKAGATSDIEVIDAERRARDAETAAVIAEDGARQARLDLLAATGRLP
ncbi:MAG TPA: TolC family protein [Polyangiales bacterium]